MLLPPSLLLARSRRRKTALAAIGAPSLETGITLLQEAAHLGRPVLVLFEPCVPDLPSLEVALFVLSAAAQSLKEEVSLAVVVENAESAPQALEAGAPALYLRPDPESKLSTIRQAAAAVQAARSYSAEVIGEASHFMTADRTAQFVRETGIQALALSIGVRQGGRLIISLSHLRSLVLATGVPLLACDRDLTPSWLRKGMAAGLAGIVTREAVGEALTAGLRTSLRGSHVTQPNQYLPKALDAVRATAHYYLNQP